MGGKLKNSDGGPSLKNVTHVKGVNHYRDAKKIARVNLLKGGKAVRNRDGKIVKEAVYQSRLPSGTVARVESNRRWFENTRVVGQTELEQYREAMTTKLKDPFSFVMHQNKLPLSLLNNNLSSSNRGPRMHILDTEAFSSAFGPKAQRKRPRITSESLQAMANGALAQEEGYKQADDNSLTENVAKAINEGRDEVLNPLMKAGQSRRIWGELYKVIDSSDVVVHVLDARDPLGTRCFAVEHFLKNEAKHKHLIFILNKCDLVPSGVAV